MRTYVSPRCGDEVGVLGLCVPGEWAVLGAISAAHHGQAIFWANRASRGPLGGLREVYVGMVLEGEKNLTKRDWG